MNSSRPERRRSGWQLLLTCEHASNAVPAPLQHLFRGGRTVLRSHRGYDIGALAVAEQMAEQLRAPLIAGNITRLLVDLNRSSGHRDVHSEFAQGLDAGARAALIARWHVPFRAAALAALQRLAVRGPVLHISVHSFTPELLGELRNCDIGLLYDPLRRAEQRMARRLAQALKAPPPALRVRMNYPYRGCTDGHTTSLRKLFADTRYLGIEIELNQADVQRASTRRARANQVIAALRQTLEQSPPAPE